MITCACTETSSADTGSSQTIRLGLQCQRAGDADALALAAGEFVRVAVERLGPQPDLERQCLDPLGQCAAARDAVIDQRLADDVADLEARVQGGVGVLEDDLQLAAPGPHLLPRQAVDALAVDANLAGGRVDQLQDRLAGGRLAAAALADETQGLALGDVERDAVDRMDLPDRALQQPLLDREMLDQSPDRQSSGLGSGHAAATRSEWKQAAKCPGSFSSKAGISRRHMSVAKAQRAANGQPGIGSLSEGTVPGISASRGARSWSSEAPSRGTEASSPLV